MAGIFSCRVLENDKIKENYFKMKISAPRIARQSKAGQFVHLRCPDSSELLLRRPFSIHRVSGDNVEILYRVVGKGTEELSKRRPGKVLDILGPLGNGFKIPDTLKPAIIIAGGIGVAPLVMLAESIKYHSSCRACSANIKVLIGAKTKRGLLCEGEFRNLGCEVKVSTEDGSKGFKGLVTDLLKQLLSTFDIRRSTVYACGPKEMLKKVSEIACKYKIPAQISLEENMACGIGACYGCPVMTKEGYKLVCSDGPVFNADEIIWSTVGGTSQKEKGKK